MLAVLPLLAAVSAHADDWRWNPAHEVPWADHTDWRIEVFSRAEFGSWKQRAAFVCVLGHYDLVLDDLNVEDDSVGHRTGLAAWWLGETYSIPAPTVAEARYRIDDGEWMQLVGPTYYGNLKAGKQVDRSVAYLFGASAVERLKAGKSMEFVAKFSDGETKRSTISLNGFTKAFDSLPTECKAAK